MGELLVTPWRRFGHDRLYVNLPDGQSAAWFDLRTGQTTILLDAYRDAAHDALASYLEKSSEPAGYPLPPPPTRSSPPPVSPPAPLTGWTPEVPEPTGSWPVPEQPASQPGSPPARPPAARSPVRAAGGPTDDLAANLPGAALRAKIEELTPGFWRALLNRLLHRPAETDGWSKGLIGEEMAGAELARLTTWGWLVLHSIPLPRDVDIDHLLIGPGGVFTINTKHHVGARVWVGDHAVKVGGQSHQYPRKARAEASRASAALSRACGFDVPVEAVLAFVAPEKLTSSPPRAEGDLIRLHAIRHSQFITFKDFPTVWDRHQVEQIHAAARDRQNWLDA
ncbi:nuclease-related domain-containing protein [Pseudofrankia inefficax]|uniref:NERD domain protein n=1 Tax=Pseudofrankia inefficax (strain DSM 45817 / CECT 9037 / DDB 130130 / EuI1c) TaxID=298654 RepID=E3IUP3_PSEI1|nr:nuclease-related domain-containing protein [Pseudofrankia inefficax]ADP84859.1 NERD domain protein [Pseudofrankia inefficax]